jgi:hypothetical protein
LEGSASPNSLFLRHRSLIEPKAHAVEDVAEVVERSSDAHGINAGSVKTDRFSVKLAGGGQHPRFIVSDDD